MSRPLPPQQSGTNGKTRHTGTTRRRALGGLLGGGAAALASLILTPPLHRLALADAPGEKRLVLLLLRGGWDGLGLLVPYGDPDYASARGVLAMPPPYASGGVIDLDGRFGLHPAATPLLALWNTGNLAFVPAAALPYGGDNHHVARARLADGASAVTENAATVGQGWLYRALSLNGNGGDALRVVSAGPSPPAVLGGPGIGVRWQAAGPTPGPRGFFERANLLYRDDAGLATALAQSRQAQERRREALGPDHGGIGAGLPPAGDRFPAFGLPRVAEYIAAALARPDGPRIAVMEMNGWDTHFSQTGAVPAAAQRVGVGGLAGGPLARRFAVLSRMLSVLARGLGPAWADTVLVAVSEFGRGITPNGAGGTDHGRAAPVLLAGGGIRGGRVVGDWPGLAPGALDRNGGLAPTLDLRAVFRAVLAGHMGLATGGGATAPPPLFPDLPPTPAIDTLLGG